MRAFIIRPFGPKKDDKGNVIDFNKVANELIGPALEAIGADGRETLDIFESGNIRFDMFRRLLTADLVIADLSIRNANVYYELGIRHALREHGTVMIRCDADADAFPFDLQTDRYFTYNRNDPKSSLPQLIDTLRATQDKAHKDYTAKDSPVFTSLPNLSEPDPSQFKTVPQDFGEDVEKAAANRIAGDLALYSYEVKSFEWEMQGWRLVGRAQFDINALAGAKTTWENIRHIEPQDLEANIRLGTIYQRLGDLVNSTQALDRALKNKAINQNQRAEAYSLIASNYKTRWRSEWESKPAAERAAAALRSPHLQESLENYEAAFDEYLNHYYSGLNALAMLKTMIALAELQPDVWAEQFPTDKKAAAALEEHQEHAQRLESAVRLSLDATFKRLEREDRKDVWAEISQADFACITTKEPARVAASYRRALANAPDFAKKSLGKQLAIYRDLGVLDGNLVEVFKVVGEPAALPEPGAQAPAAPSRKRVLVFAGHLIDAPDRPKPRFPREKEPIAREKIKEAVLKEMNSGAGVAAAYAGGGSGGDLLFQEVCAEVGIESWLYLAVLPQIYVTTSVSEAGGNWVQRFWDVHTARVADSKVRVLSPVTEARENSVEYLPAWLRDKEKYTIWQRNNLWMLFNALAESCDEKTGDPNLTLIALWDGKEGDGPGGTGDLVHKVKTLGARVELINTIEAFGL
ncbi:MAG TPA: tetratricopeptide repeat-containing protein [Pyrinomonadaceae bacterium]|nr:tetratricopeptide repeat-containing protein [Pyrinomonadaceae bacterium]